MTRVLMIAPTPFFADRGCHVRIYEEARSLSARGVEVRIVTYPLGSDPPGLHLRRPRRLLPYRREEAGPAWSRLFLDAQTLAAAIRECRAFRPDLLHVHLHEGGLIGLALSRLFRLPLLFDYQGSLTEESVAHGFIAERGLPARLFRRVERLIDRGADAIVVSSGALAEPLRALGLRVEVVTDGVDLERFRPGPADAALAESLRLPAGTPLAVYLGAMSDYQGVDLLLRAARLLRDGGARVHFLLMGYPEAGYRREAARLGLEGRVTFTGRVGYFEAQRYLRLGAMALAPKLARTEANGKVLNYLACGLPVVAFDLPVNRELLGDTAEWVPAAGDSAERAREFAAAIARLLAEPDRAADMGRAGRELAVVRHSVTAEAEKLLQAYEALLRP